MTVPKIYQEALDAACKQFGITGKKKAAFLAHCAVESAGFTKLRENLLYTTPQRVLQVFPSRIKNLEEAKRLTKNPEALANTVYAGRLGNGPSVSGDGWRYAGKGLFQLTGRANYAEAAKALGYPYESHPDLLLEPKHAALTAAWFWVKSGCNEAIDRGDFDFTTRKINGSAQLHAKERLAIYNKNLLSQA